MQPISADSHVVEGPDVFAGLADRFGDEAPRVVHTEGEGDRIVIPAWSPRGVSVAQMGLASTRLARNEPLARAAGHKRRISLTTMSQR